MPALTVPPNPNAPETPRDVVLVRTRSPLLGVRVANLSPALAEELRLDAAISGVVVVEVENGSAAQTYGFQKGDVVLQINNAPIETTADLVRATTQPSRLWRLTILRGGQQISAVLGG